jgi:type III pantothenate kinase
MTSAPAILAIDAGNTRIKWGVHDGNKWNPSGALPTAEAQRLAEIWDLVPKVPAIASNVAGPDVEQHIRNACERWGLLPIRFIRSEREQLGVTNGYDDPHQLGPDRWAGLIAAHHLYTGPKLVVNAGTALTIDALTADGRFLGGIIVPGPALMRRSLDRGTAGLRLTEGVYRPAPASTPDAITSGSLHACIGAIERMRQSMAAQGTPPEGIIVSGGAAVELAPHLPEPHVVEEHLVLHGLVLIARGG